MISHTPNSLTIPGAINPRPIELEDESWPTGFGNGLFNFSCLESLLDDKSLGQITVEMKSTGDGRLYYKKIYDGLCTGKIMATLYDLDMDKTYAMSYVLLDNDKKEIAKESSKPFFLKSDAQSEEFTVPIIFE